MSEEPIRLNVYDCPECKGETVTVDLDKGVTPMMLGCRDPRSPGCRGMARSRMYQVSTLWVLRLTHVWYRPDRDGTLRIRPIHPHEHSKLIARVREQQAIASARARLGIDVATDPPMTVEHADGSVNVVDDPFGALKAEVHRFEPAPQRDPEDFQRELASVGLGRKKPRRPR